MSITFPAKFGIYCTKNNDFVSYLLMFCADQNFVGDICALPYRKSLSEFMQMVWWGVLLHRLNLLAEFCQRTAECGVDFHQFGNLAIAIDDRAMRATTEGASDIR
jgi:hypothetical protein